MSVQPPRPCSDRSSALTIPSATLRGIEAAPADRPVVLLLRHSARPSIPDGDVGNDLPLTAKGRALAEELGAVLGRRLSTVRTSPVRRCVETASALLRGARVLGEPVADRLLGDPGVYISDPERAWEQTWRRMDFEEILAALVEGNAALPGFSPPALAAVRLLEHMVDLAAGPGMHVFVSHDSIVLPTAAHLLGQRLTRPDWPEYLDAVVLWRDIDAIEVRYRGRSARRRQLVR